MMTRKITPPILVDQAEIFKLLSHPCRLAILYTLRSGEECVCHMEATLGYRQAYLSQQLAVLREAGIIQDRRDGPRWVEYLLPCHSHGYLPHPRCGQRPGGQPGGCTPGARHRSNLPLPQMYIQPGASLTRHHFPF